MLKKIKDLTPEELKYICDKQKYCSKCPLSICGGNCLIDYILNKKKYEVKIEKEIKVE